MGPYRLELNMSCKMADLGLITEYTEIVASTAGQLSNQRASGLVSPPSITTTIGHTHFCFCCFYEVLRMPGGVLMAGPGGLVECKGSRGTVLLLVSGGSISARGICSCIREY